MAARPVDVEGKDVGKIFVYALSTCGWCKRTKRLLNELGIAYSFIDVDRLNTDEREATKDDIRKYNPKCTFPTVVINETECVIGHNEEKLRKVLGL